MEKHFSDIHYAYVANFSPKSYFVHVGCPKMARRILDRSKSFKLDGFPGVKILPTLTRIDISRIWALRAAEEVLKDEPRASGRNIEVKKGKDRGIYMDGTVVFQQEARYDPRGDFTGELSDLRLPQRRP